MSNISVQHDNLKNQGPSWIDDPFDLPWVMQGAPSLSHTRQLQLYAQDLVINNAKFDDEGYSIELQSLPEYAQNELVRLYVESIDRDISDAVHGDDFSIDNNYTSTLLAMLKDDNKETREAFAKTTRKNLITYYLKDLQKELDDACHECLEISMNDAGYYSRQSMDSGEFEWRKV